MKTIHHRMLISALALVAVSGVAWAGAGGGGFDSCIASVTCAVIAVPEPTSLALLATAIGGLAWARFRRRS